MIVKFGKKKIFVIICYVINVFFSMKNLFDSFEILYIFHFFSKTFRAKFAQILITLRIFDDDDERKLERNNLGVLIGF